MKKDDTSVRIHNPDDESNGMELIDKSDLESLNTQKSKKFSSMKKKSFADWLKTANQNIKMKND
jgi:hypothetical protein